MTETVTMFRAWMERCGLTKAEAAKRLGVSQALVTCLRSGTLRWRKRPVPALPNILTRYAMVAIELDLAPVSATEADPMHGVEALAMAAILAGFEPHEVEDLQEPEDGEDDLGARVVAEELNVVRCAPEAPERQKERAGAAASPPSPARAALEDDLW